MLSLLKKITLSLCLVALLSFVQAFAFVQANEIKEIDQQSVLASEDLLVVDVRTPEEYAQGHVPGAINVPVAQFAENLHLFTDKEQSIVTYCRSGRRAMTALNVLKENGYTNLSHLEGHIRAWEASELPMTIPETKSEAQP